MSDINNYIDAAIEKQGFKSDRELSIALGFKTSGVSFWRTGRAFPNDDKMIQLAKMADLNPVDALMDLNTWRSPRTVQAYYVKAKKALQNASLVALALAVSIVPASASTGDPVNVQEGFYILWKLTYIILYTAEQGFKVLTG